MALRAGFLVISILFGLALGFLAGNGTMSHAAIGAGFGALLSGVLVFVEIAFMEPFPARTLVYGGIGFSLGMLLSGMCIFLTLFLAPHPILRLISFATLLMFPYLGLTLGVRFGKEYG